MNESLRECLNTVVNKLRQFKQMHTLGETASDEEVDLIEDAADSLVHASEIVGELDGMRVNGRRRDSVKLELERQSKELRGAAQMMTEYETRESGRAKMPTSYDTVTHTITWIEDFL